MAQLHPPASLEHFAHTARYHTVHAALRISYSALL